MSNGGLTLLILIFSALVIGCHDSKNSYTMKKDGKAESHVCDYGQGHTETIILSDCSLQFEQYARDYTFAVDISGKAKVTLGAPPKEFITLSENAQLLIIAHASLCRDRNACIYPRKEYIERKQQYDFAFAKLKAVAKAVDAKVKNAAPGAKPPVLRPGEDKMAYSAASEAREFNKIAKSILYGTAPPIFTTTAAATTSSAGLMPNNRFQPTAQPSISRVRSLSSHLKILSRKRFQEPLISSARVRRWA